MLGYCLDGNYYHNTIFTESNYGMFYDMCAHAIREYPNKSNIKLVYFHNLKYDSALIDYDKMRNVQLIMKNGAIYSIKFDFNDHKFELRDSLKHLTFPLKDFNKTLGLKLK